MVTTTSNPATSDRPVWFITGCSTGFGRELVKHVLERGYRTVVTARKPDEVKDLAAKGEALVLKLDVTDQGQIDAAIKAAEDKFGRIDVLVNNAGIGASGRFDEITDLSLFETLMRVNYLGSVWSTAYALPFLKQSRGRLVAISSLTGLTGVPKRTAYAATKHAMAGFFDSLRIELQQSGVSVTVVYPGFVLSEINRHALSPNGQPFGDRGFQRTAVESMAVDTCCRIILRAVARRDRDVVMTWRGKIGRFLKVFAPAVVDAIARRTINARQ